MTTPGTSRLFATWLRLVFGRLSVFTATSLSFGATAGLLSQVGEFNPWLWFVFGSFLPMGPMLWYFSSTRALRRTLRGWLALKEEKLITEQQFAQFRKAAVAWYTGTLFGQSGLASPDGGQADNPLSLPESPPAESTAS